MRLPAQTKRRITAIACAITAVTLVMATAACSSNDEPSNASATTSASPTDSPSTASATPSTPPTAAPTTTPGQANGSTPAPTATSQPRSSASAAPKPSATATPKPTATPRAKPRITVSKTSGLNPNGQSITVTGTGFDVNKGVYIALCVKPAKGQLPSPCGGGVDTSGTSGASAWISSNPPRYAVNLTKPYGPNGSFKVTIKVSSEISKTIDCRSTTCVIATRNDHTRSSDRGQDVFVPVTFAKS